MQKEPMTFSEYLVNRNPQLFIELSGDLGDLGIDPSNRQQMKALLAQLAQQQKSGKPFDIKQTIADLKANPNPNQQQDPNAIKKQLAADQEFQRQQDMQSGKITPRDVDPQDWKSAVSAVTPTGKPIPNQIGKGDPVDIAKTLSKGGAQGALPQDAPKLMPKWLNMGTNAYKPPLDAKLPQVDPKNKMTPSEIAKAKSKPGLAAPGSAQTGTFN